MLWFSTFGGSAIYFELNNQSGIADAVAVEAPAGLYVLLNQLPGGNFMAIVAILLVAMFVITSADSATFVLGMFTSKGVLNPTRFVRILWGGLQLLVAAVLLLSGGLYGLRTVSIIAAFPFMLIMILMTISLYKDLALEFRRRERRTSCWQPGLKTCCSGNQSVKRNGWPSWRAIRPPQRRRGLKRRKKALKSRCQPTPIKTPPIPAPSGRDGCQATSILLISCFGNYSASPPAAEDNPLTPFSWATTYAKSLRG